MKNLSLRETSELYDKWIVCLKHIHRAKRVTKAIRNKAAKLAEVGTLIPNERKD